MFYGVVEEILELTYLTLEKVVLFRCKWFKTNNTNRTELCATKNNITSISTRDDWWRHQQYILATQATQVFYLEDPSRSHHWKVVEDVNHRKIWDKDIIVDVDVIHDNISSNLALTANLENLEYIRLSEAGPSTEVDIPTSLMAMVAHGHGGDNGPPNNDRPWEPPKTHKNPKGRKRGHDAKLEKKFDDGGKKNFPLTLTMAFFNMKPHLTGQKEELFQKGMKVEFRNHYRNRKNKFKKEHFVDQGGYEHPEEIRNFPPENMSLSDWHKFCDHVTSATHMKRSQANKANRGKQLYTSNHGSKSYAQSRHEEWADGKGSYPDLVEQFKDKHVYKKGDKKGQWKTKAAEDKYNRMLEIRAGQQGQEEQLTDKEIVSQVLGTKRGFNPGRGRVLAGSSSSSSVRSHPAPAQQMTQSQINALVKIATDTRKHVVNLHEQLADRNIIDLPPLPELDPSLFSVVDEEEDADEPARIKIWNVRNIQFIPLAVEEAKEGMTPEHTQLVRLEEKTRQHGIGLWDRIRNYVKFRRVMQIILSLGNALNHGTSRGTAVGFKLDTLLKLNDTRSRNKTMTLMHYLCKIKPFRIDRTRGLSILKAWLLHNHWFFETERVFGYAFSTYESKYKLRYESSFPIILRPGMQGQGLGQNGSSWVFMKMTVIIRRCMVEAFHTIVLYSCWLKGIRATMTSIIGDTLVQSMSATAGHPWHTHVAAVLAAWICSYPHLDYKSVNVTSSPLSIAYECTTGLSIALKNLAELFVGMSGSGNTMLHKNLSMPKGSQITGQGKMLSTSLNGSLITFIFRLYSGFFLSLAVIYLGDVYIMLWMECYIFYFTWASGPEGHRLFIAISNKDVLMQTRGAETERTGSQQQGLQGRYITRQLEIKGMLDKKKKVRNLIVSGKRILTFQPIGSPLKTTSISEVYNVDVDNLQAPLTYKNRQEVDSSFATLTFHGTEEGHIVCEGTVLKSSLNAVDDGHAGHQDLQISLSDGVYPVFGSFLTPTFGVSITVASGAPTIPVFGTSGPPAFAASSTPASDSLHTPTFDAIDFSFSFSFSPMFGLSRTAFGAIRASITTYDHSYYS
ncbi:formin-like protein 18 [Artemisia annua]|uniref:Formin-like protein 18 n=1 Tax=Artemisia annua TaxID=35608 RepID=A0A2U1QFB7_ARTAN|nr:formin-like protein 18 [Artemisia annua]